MEELIDPEYHNIDDEPYEPSSLAQALIGAAIMLTIGLAFVGAADVLQSALQGLQ